MRTRGSTIQRDDRPRRREGVVWRRGEDGLVLLNPHDGSYFALDDVGARLWELCDETRSIAQIAEVLAGEYDASADEIEGDALELLRELRDEGLVHAR